jgi:hypothetical protein
MLQRENYIRWLADFFVKEADGRPLILLGTSYKPKVPLETGSSSLLLAYVLRQNKHDIRVIPNGSGLPPRWSFKEPAAFFLGCPDQEFLDMEFPAGSIVVDPWHLLKSDEVKVVHIGH